MDLAGSIAPDTDAASVPPETVCRVRIPGLRRALRFAPSSLAPLAMIVDSGELLDVVDMAGGDDTWLQVRAPRGVRLWVPRTALSPVGDRFRIHTVGVQARSDARTGASAVADLVEGEMVEDLHRTLGDFHAVHVPNAMVYLHRVGIDLPTDFPARLARARAERDEVRQQSHHLQRLLGTDADGRATDRRPIDRVAVAGTAARIAEGHSDVAARISAVRILSRIPRRDDEAGVDAPAP